MRCSFFSLDTIAVAEIPETESTRVSKRLNPELYPALASDPPAFSVGQGARIEEGDYDNDLLVGSLSLLI